MTTSTRATRERGQSLVEFSLALSVFVLLLMGVLDFGMAIYKHNAVSQAAREIARVASVHQGTNFASSEISAVQATQRVLVPELSVLSIACTDIDGAAVTLVNDACPTTAFVRVTVTAPYKPGVPLLAFLGTFTLSGSSSAQVQQ